MENIGLALQLMVVGMATVFIILLIVIQLGKWLISLVNKFAPAEAPVTHRTAKQPQHSDIAPQTVAIIRSAVEQITNGKGQVKHIERL